MSCPKRPSTKCEINFARALRKSIFFISLFTSNLLFIFPVFAAITKMSVNEATASKVMVDGETTYIFGGSAGSCSETAAGSVCDSCSKITTLCDTIDRSACNNRSIHSDLALEFNFQVDQVPTGAALYAKLGSEIVSIYENSDTLAVNQDLYIRIKWSKLIESVTTEFSLCDSSDSGDCGKGNVSGDLTVGLSVDSGATFAAKKEFKLEYRGVTATSRTQDFHTDCAAETDASDDEGFCSFSVYPGDGKVYVKDLKRASATPSGATKIRWAAARFYYTDTGSDFCALSPSLKTYKDLAVADRSNSANTDLVSKKIEELTNDTLYRFMMASVDDAGNVEYFSDPSSSDGYLKDATHSARPTEVVGLLDGKKCFIATAAFGSEMDPHVETLRLFRDQIMLKFALGRFLVRNYYRFSPPLAKFIADKAWLQTFVRGLLWPIIGFADVLVTR